MEARQGVIVEVFRMQNCPDLRNTRVVDIIEELRGYGCVVDVHDPWADGDEAEQEYGITPVKEPGEVLMTPS